MPNYSDIGFCIKQIHDRMEKMANNAMRPNDLTMMQVSVNLTEYARTLATFMDTKHKGRSH